MFDDESICPIVEAKPTTFDEAMKMLIESMNRHYACYYELEKERKKHLLTKEYLELAEKQIDRLLSKKIK